MHQDRSNEASLRKILGAQGPIATFAAFQIDSRGLLMSTFKTRSRNPRKEEINQQIHKEKSVKK